MRPQTAWSIVVIGAGFTGAMVTAHLLRQRTDCRREVVLINRSGPMARGLAYGTRTNLHVLNVPAGRMGAFADDEAGFLRFVQQQRPDVHGGDFLPRSWYGEYLETVLATAEQQAPRGVTLTRIVGETMAVTPLEAGGASVTLRDGRTLRANRVVLALGNFAPADPFVDDTSFRQDPHYIRDPWARGALSAVRADRPVLLIGTGLTMADVALSIGNAEGARPVYVVSRHGLLPQAHRSPAQPRTHRHLPPDLLTGPPTARAYLASVRRHVRAVEHEGIDWRDVIGSLRASTPALWDALTIAERARFLRHVRAYWEVHRHRAAPQIAERLRAMVEDGRLVPLAGRVLGCEAAGDGIRATVRIRGTYATRTLDVGAVVNCTGPDGNLRRLDEPLIRHLLDAGLARPDALGLGIDTSDEYELIDAAGRPSPVLFYVGPLLKAKYWESTAVPELRVHVARLVERLAQSMAIARR